MSVPESKPSAVFDEALKRAALLSVIVFGLSFAAGLAIPDYPLRYILATSLTPAITAFATRAGIEGYRDHERAVNGKSIPGDVAVASPRLNVTPIVRPRA